MALWQKLRKMQPAIVRHLVTRNYQAYEQILKHIRARGDIWITSQGEYISWWQKRDNASLKITVSGGRCQVYTSLENAVIEKFPGKFLESTTVPCKETTFSGDIWITIDSTLEKKEVLIELLKREGILNFRIAEKGEFMLSRQEMQPILDVIDAKLRQKDSLFENDIPPIRQLVIEKLDRHNLPLLRIWYHPRVNGIIPKAVFSPRFDVDRAITNLARIRALEQKYNATSTLYIRAFCPFYSDREIAELAAMPWCSEIALHGEFVTNARQYGNEFEATRAEKVHLEKLIGRPVRGVGIHGGELAYNKSKNTTRVIEKAGLLYDTTPAYYYRFPFKVFVNGQLSQYYIQSHALSDVTISADRRYAQSLYEQVMAKMDEIYQKNGVFVMMLHPVYFGFFSYLAWPRNWGPFVKFFLNYFKQAGSRG